MSTFIEIQQQIKELEVKAKQVREAEIGPAIQTIKETMDLYGITASDLGFKAAARARPSDTTTTKVVKKVEAKYRDDKGNVWSGRGLKPKWLTAALANGRSLDDFVLAAPDAG